MNAFLNICIGTLVVGMIATPFVVTKAAEEFEYHNCKITEGTRIVPITTTLVIGKVIIPVTNMQEQHKYTCDDYPRWD